MPVNFDKALKAGMKAFAIPVIVRPIASQPGFPEYTGRAVPSVRPVDVGLEAGAVLSSEEKKLGIRLVDYDVPPGPGDQISQDGGETWYWIDDSDPDEINIGATLALKAASDE